MKICPNCHVDCENPLETCWNCNYSFIEGRLIPDESKEPADNTVFKTCPNCNAEVEENFEMCWNCNYSFEENKVVEIKDTVTGLQDIECLRCKVPMKYGGDFKFHEGPRAAPLYALYEFLENNDHFDIYVCPDCGKVEFFIPSGTKPSEYSF